MSRICITLTLVNHLIICWLVCQTAAQEQQNSAISLIYDDSIDLQFPRDSLESMIQIIADNLKAVHQHRILIDFTRIEAKTNYSEITTSPNYDNRANGFIILTQCETVEAIIHRLRTLQHNPNIIFLDFFICQPLRESGVFHLETFRLNNEKRPDCVQFAVHKWMEDTIGSSRLDQPTERLLNLTFTVDDVLSKCNRNHHSITKFEVSLPNLKSEENYIRRFLSGKHLRVTTFEEPPLIFFDRSPSNASIVNYRGIPFNILNTMQECFNFTYDVVVPESGGSNSKLNNDIRDGLEGMLFDKVASVAIHYLYVTHERIAVFDFASFGEDPLAILIPASDGCYWASAEPFQADVWLGVGVILLLLPLIIWICTKYLGASREIPLIKFYLHVYSVLVSQSNGPKIPRNKLFLAILVVGWSFVALILSNTYQGKLLSSLLTAKHVPIINSLEDLPASPLRWTVFNGTPIYTTIMAEERDNVYWEIGEGIRRSPELVMEFESQAEVRHLVASGGHAAIWSLSNLKHLMREDYSETKKCRLSLAKETFYKPANTGLMFRKGSPLATVFNKK